MAVVVPTLNAAVVNVIVVEALKKGSDCMCRVSGGVGVSLMYKRVYCLCWFQELKEGVKFVYFICLKWQVLSVSPSCCLFLSGHKCMQIVVNLQIVYFNFKERFHG